MAKRGNGVEGARSAALSQKGIKTSQDFADMMTALMSDIIEERVTPQVANAAIRAGATLLRVVELQVKYGTPVPAGDGARTLRLASGPVTETAPTS